MATPKTGVVTDRTREECITLLDLVAAVEAFAESDAEITATLRHLAKTGRVKLEAGSFAPLLTAA